MSTQKVIFVGNAGTGKTYVARALEGNSSTESTNYFPTCSVEVFPYHGKSGIIYNIWDCAGQQHYSGLKDGYYIGADIAIIFTGGLEDRNPDLFGNQPYKEWEKRVKRVMPHVTIYHVHNPSLTSIRKILV